ncbi:alpha/beta-hydrolase [Desarmillaria tabescens]|uniref:Alpha/beta-hydrolase n=1 Tax=Armillaria tabescens TaxID=1929756 RepID=A0AA39NJT6_ARMTA|nr:alpha/beta-hydrolase [Desarmillaria tabescens]KAK0466793.1 alpha/beta-hydrolase [Desarmillaria tabescens]
MTRAEYAIRSHSAMKASTFALFVLTFVFRIALAVSTSLHSRQGITVLTTAEIATFKPYTFFASAGYCEPDATLAWDCGSACQANSDFKPVASGGDGADVQFWYVGYSPSLSTVIVAHQGTDPSQIVPLLTDGDFALAPLDSNIFPGISSDILVHDGFSDTQARSAKDILRTVTTALSEYNTNSVTLVGHSLGAALSLLDTVYLSLHLNASYRMVGYGLPRVGNQEFADYLDASFPGKISHINNKQDPIPILPGMALGFHQPSGEIHIDSDDNWNSCPGQGLTRKRDVLSGMLVAVFVGDLNNHDGPYDGVEMDSGC